MWISKIEIVCFKSYRKQEFTFPQPQDGRNIAVIGGLNGYGKTTILEALYLCLYGKDAIAHLARAGLKTDETRGYPSFLEKAFNGEAQRAGNDTMIVKVVVSTSKTKAFEIARRWYFRANGTWDGEEATYRDIVRGIPGMARLDGKSAFHLTDILDERFVPAHIAPFFFFDGEEVKKLADQSRVEQVKQGLEGLLGVVLLRSLCERLRAFERSKRENFAKVDEDRLMELHDTLEEKEAASEGLARKIDAAGARRSELQGEFDSLLERVTAAGGGGGDTATYKDSVEQREQLRNELRENNKKLEEMLAGRLPLHLVAKELTDDLRSQLEAEVKYLRWQTERQALEPRQREFETALAAQTAPELTPPLTADQEHALMERVRRAWGTLFYPPPNDCASDIEHDYLSPDQRMKMLDALTHQSLGQTEITELMREQSQLSDRITQLTHRISRLEGIDRDGTLAELTAELKRVREEIDALDDAIRVDDRRLVALRSEVDNLRADYERDKKRLDESSPARRIVSQSERVRSVIEEVIPALFPLKVKELGIRMTQVYRQLAHKDQVSKIEIGDDGSTTILSKSGTRLSFDRSAGENQIFATALIAGLAKVSGVRAPLVVDTPLGRLDSRHRENILKFWTSEKDRQVILLSQDEEIDEDLKQRISGSIGKTYLLQHAEVGDGIGRTVALEDAYFGAYAN